MKYFVILISALVSCFVIFGIMAKLLNIDSTGLTDNEVATLWVDKSLRFTTIEYEKPKREPKIRCVWPGAKSLYSQFAFEELHKTEIIEYTPVAPFINENIHCLLNKAKCEKGI